MGWVKMGGGESHGIRRCAAPLSTGPTVAVAAAAAATSPVTTSMSARSSRSLSCSSLRVAVGSPGVSVPLPCRSRVVRHRFEGADQEEVGVGSTHPVPYRMVGARQRALWTHDLVCAGRVVALLSRSVKAVGGGGCLPRSASTSPAVPLCLFVSSSSTPPR